MIQICPSTDVTAPYNCSELISILMTDDIDSHRVCRTRPLSVSENATFVSLDCVRFDDLKADDMGSWTQTGSKHKYFRIDDQGHILYSQSSHGGRGYYCLLRRYYVHGTCSTFHRLIVSLEGCPFALLRFSTSTSIPMYLYMYYMCTMQ